MNPRIFKEYDIRGKAGIDFDADFVYQLGLACAKYFLESKAETVALAYDCRHTSLEYYKALSLGLTEGGVDCIALGLLPTPCLYYGVKHLDLKAGIMITASHNPGEYNGFKIVCGKSTIYGNELIKIKNFILNKEFVKAQVHGKITEKNIIPNYIDDIVTRLGKIKPYKVVVDAGNGVGGLVCVPLLKKMGAEVIELFCEPDGTFPNHHPDPVVPKNAVMLIDAVKKHNADLGFGLDGDGDRLGVVDKNGRLLFGDELLAIFARDILKHNKEALFIADVKASERLFTDTHLNGKVLMNKTGHSLIKARMQEVHAMAAGELSGHMFFADNWYGFDDGTYTAARLLAVLTTFEKDDNLFLHELPGWENLYSTPEITLPCPDDKKIHAITALQNSYNGSALYHINQLDGLRVTRKEGPLLWGLARMSNTSPYLTLRAEGKNKEEVEALIEEFCEIGNKAIQG